MKLINLYGQGIMDCETSPFEMQETFHIRSELHRLSLTKEEKKMLATYDMKLLNNIERIFEHTSKAYDFSMSKEEMEEWWWLLDLLLKGEILFSVPPFETM